MHPFAAPQQQGRQCKRKKTRAVASQIGERPDLHGSVAGRGSHLAAHNLAAFHESLGHAEQAALWRERSQLWRAGV